MSGDRALEVARSRVAMARLIGWEALAQSWQRTCDELTARGAEDRLHASHKRRVVQLAGVAA